MFVGSVQIISRQIVKVQDVYTIFRPPCYWSKELHQHGGSTLGSVNLRKTFRRILSLGTRRDPKREKMSTFPIS